MNNGDNLNVKLGPYGSASNDIVGSLLNKPTQVVDGEVTIDWYPSNDSSSYGTQILRHTRDSTINIYFRAKRGSVDNWSGWINLVTKDDLTPAFTKVGSGYGLEALHAAIGKLHILRLAGNTTSAFSNFNLTLPDSCDGFFISESGKIENISYTIEINNKHLIVTPSTPVPVGKYFIHWLIYYGY